MKHTAKQMMENRLSCIRVNADRGGVQSDGKRGRVMTSRVEELQRMCDNINENGGLDSGEWHTALLAQIAQNLAVIADVMMADRKTEQTEREGE